MVETKPGWYYRQSAAIPVLRSAEGLRILLIANRTGKRWTIPKGIVERHLTPAESAAKEAWEEAGVRGTLWPQPLGVYQAEKWGGVCTIEVFLLYVEEVADRWPESQRRRRWTSADEAAGTVDSPGLAEILRRVPGILGREGEAA